MYNIYVFLYVYIHQLLYKILDLFYKYIGNLKQLIKKNLPSLKCVIFFV